MNNLRLACRRLYKDKKFSLINISGFAVAISVCLMITLYLKQEYHYDRHNPNADRLFRLIDTDDNTSSIDFRIKDRLLGQDTDILDICLIQTLTGPQEITLSDRGVYLDGIMSVDNAFFNMFSIPLVSGQTTQAMPTPNSAVLTRSAANRLFPKKNPLGQEILIKHKTPVIISAIIEDFPKSSSFNSELLVNAENKAFKFYVSCENSEIASSYRYPFNIYLMLAPKADPDRLISRLNKETDLLSPYTGNVGLLGLPDIHLYDRTSGGFTQNKGNPKLLLLFGLIAVIVFLLAVINHINLTLARQNRRLKETGIRKVIGAGRREIVLLYLIEPVVILAVSLAASLAITSVSLPWFNQIVNSHLAMGSLMQPAILGILFLICLLTGILAGLIPALRLSSFQPNRVLSGHRPFKTEHSRFRQPLIIFQFSVSITLIFCLLVLLKQIHYVKHADAGINTEHLLCINLPNIQNKDLSREKMLTDRWCHAPEFLNISMTGGVPGQIISHMGSGVPDKAASMAIIYADKAFLDTFRPKLVKGRPPLPSEYGSVCLLNETAYRYFEWPDLTNRRYNNGRKGGFSVVGVFQDFQIASRHSPIEPVVILFQEYFTHITLRIAPGQLDRAMQTIRSTWAEILPEYPLKYQFYDDWFDSLYRKEERLAGTIALFSILAISISCLGILGLAIYAAETRVKEFAIRKALGAGTGELLTLMNRYFVQLVLVAVVIALPLAWWIMQTWLQDFAYRTAISWWIFLLSGSAAVIIALISVSWQAWRVASLNPVQSLKHE